VAVIEGISEVSSVGHRKLRREFGLVGLLFASLGSIIGSGWLLGAWHVAVLAGPAALLAWVIGAAAVFLIALVYAELGGMHPVAAGGARFPHYAFGNMAGFAAGWFTYLGVVATAPVEVEAALQYATSYLQGLTASSGGAVVLTGKGYVVGAALMLLFCVINVLGVRWLAEVNKYAVYWKVAIPFVTVFALLIVSHHASNFTAGGGFFSQGLPAVLSAVATGGIMFSCMGFEQAVQFGAESRNPRRNIPMAVIGSVVFGVCLYIALQIAFLAAVDPALLRQGWSGLQGAFKRAAFGPFGALASGLGLGWLAFLLYVDAVISPSGTGLIYAGSTARITFGMARNRYLPSPLGLLSGKGVPLVAIAFAFLVGMIALGPFPDWQRLVGFITSATVLAYALQPVTLSALRRQVPDQARPYRLPFAGVIAPLAFIVASELLLFSGWDVVWKLLVAIVIGLVLFSLTVLASPRSQRPEFDFLNSSWIWPYLAGVGLISFLGAAEFGGRNILHFGVDMGVMAIFSLAIYLVAVNLRLPGDRARSYISSLAAEAEAEVEEVAIPEALA
jgi:amino acid transporter